MANQIIFVMEADEKSRSDYIYIRSVLDKYYDFRKRSDVKITPVFMCGKGNYNKKKIRNKVEDCIKRYRNLGESDVIYCFDTDMFDSEPEDKRIMLDEQRFCIENGYEFVWFCHNIEEVFLGKSVGKNEKTEKARRYVTSGGIDKVKRDRLNTNKMHKGNSNLLLVVDKYFKV